MEAPGPSSAAESNMADRVGALNLGPTNDSTEARLSQLFERYQVGRRQVLEAPAV